MAFPRSLALLDQIIAFAEGADVAPLHLTGAYMKPKEAKSKKEKKESTQEGEAPKKQDKPKKETKAPAPAASGDQPDITKLSIVVGHIGKAWELEGSEKLFAEEIDVGEEAPRQIASGLRQHYSVEQMQGRRVLVVTNLKAKKLAGFPSHGMVLCAKSADMSKVEFVEPPEGAPVGERIHFEGLVGEPITPAQVSKKKVWEACSPLMRTDANRVACVDGVPFMTSAGPCIAPTVANGSVN